MQANWGFSLRVSRSFLKQRKHRRNRGFDGAMRTVCLNSYAVLCDLTEEGVARGQRSLPGLCGFVAC